MSGFSADWLALREPYDLAARNATVLDAVAGAFAGQRVDRGRRSRLRHRRDAACARRAHLPPRQSWRLVDNDLSLLARASALGQPPRSRRSPRGRSISCAISSSRSMARSISSPPRRCSISSRPNGSTASSSRRRPGACRSTRRSPMTAAPSSSRAASLDAEVLAGFNLHQRTDKGFGPALGPTAAARAVRALRAFRLRGRAGPFRLGVRAGRSRHPGRAVRRLGRARGRDHGHVGGRDRALARASPRLSGGRPLAACASVTSTSSPGRPATR